MVSFKKRIEMGASIVVVVVLLVYFFTYKIYGNFLAKKIFVLKNSSQTPAHEFNDDVDYVPTKKIILFGHHYASIAGLSPMLGPAVAVIWGFVPALLWVVLGSLFIGCVHDFGSLVLSVRHQGKSIGAIAESIFGVRAKCLMHGIIFFLVSLGMGVFVYVIAFLFSPAKSPKEMNFHYPEAVIPSFGLMIIAVVVALLHRRLKMNWQFLVAGAFVLLLCLMWISTNDEFFLRMFLRDPSKAFDLNSYSLILLLYAFFASVLPVWLLLQPRDFLNSLLLYLGLFLIFAAIIYGNPQFVAPAFRLHPEGAPPLFPFVFIVIACGSISGFHSLVASGTTSKQLNREGDAKFIGYGGMIGESMLGVIAILATTAGFTSSKEWLARYESWESVQGLGPQVSGFIFGAAGFLREIGIPIKVGSAFISVIVVSFALTSLDSATRLLRYNIEEIMESLKLTKFSNRFFSSAVAVVSIGFFAFYRIDAKPAGLALWSLFGTTNQILAGLSLLLIAFFVFKGKKSLWPIILPMIFVLAVTLSAMALNLITFIKEKNFLLSAVGSLLLAMALALIIEAILQIKILHRSAKKTLKNC